MQRGATGFAMLLMLVSMLGMLGLMEIGYLYWAKRDTQKVADLAALAGAQDLNACVPGNQGNTAASGNARTENGFTQTLTVTCGTWDPVANAGIVDHFSATPAGGTPNAVKVLAQRPVLPIWGMAGAFPDVSAEAVASGLQPIAVFSIGSTLATVDGSAPLGQLLAGIGIQLSGVSLVGYNGLATAKITPAGLLQQLGVAVPSDITVGGLNQLLAASVQAHALIDVLNAVVNAAGQQQLLSTNATLVNALTTQLGTAPGKVTLGSTGTANAPGSLFAQITAPDSAAQTALNAQVDALQVIATAIGVATGQHAAQLTLGTPASVLGLNINTAVAVVEPPSIGIGGVGTTASTSQIRAFIEVTLSTNSIPLIGTLASTLAHTSISLDVPIAVDLVNAKATLNSLCTDAAPPQHATFGVTSSILNMCVGGITQANAFSTAGSCSQIPVTNTNPMLQVKVDNLLVSTGKPFSFTGLTANGTGTLAVGDSANIPSDGTALNIGTTLGNMFNALLPALVLQTSTGSPNSMSGALAADLWQNTTSYNKGLTPNLNQLNAALGQLNTDSTALKTFLQGTPQQVTDILGSALTLNVSGLLSGVTGVLGGVTNLLGNTLLTVGCVASSSACIALIQNAMNGGTTSQPNVLAPVLGLATQLLQAPLNALGQSLTTFLTSELGIDLGVSTVNLQSLQCHGVQLVY